MVLVIYCPNCGSKLNAPENLLGQTRSCPKCREPVLIEPPKSEPETVTEDMLVPDAPPMSTLGMLGTVTGTRPVRLEFGNRYFVVGYDRMIAYWEAGKSWQLNVGNGYAPAKKNAAAIPDQGTFILIELLFGDTEIGNAPIGMRFFRIVKRGALTAMYRDESEILNTIEGPGTLTKTQKAALMSTFQKMFMQTFFDATPAIFEFLTNDDISSHGVERLE